MKQSILFWSISPRRLRLSLLDSVMNEEQKVVCVTGGSGYIASWLIKFLLQSGYTVKATVRNPNDIKKNTHLLTLDGAQERLTLFKADLLDEGSFDAAVDGCDGVFHTASPVSFSATDPQTGLIDPAVKGTLNVLKSCAKVRSIKRVVLTSSFATLPYNGKPLTPDVVVDETWFSDPYICKQQKLWYQMGKTLAEQAAWKFASDNSIDLVTLHPVIVIGPILQPTLNMSVEIILNLVNGSKEYPDAYCKSVDVRDVAYAHIKAFESSSATGRYCLIERELHFSEILKILHQHYPTLQLPEKYGAALNHMIKYQVSKEKAKELGINFIPLEDSLKDTIESLKEKGFLSI
ncbi:NAD(P)-binding Rossmann-fold superfamily protein [Euphorbia peplus]|nr:NAD(P)-binding Rossmann-fold superfamily protein [Euphorbia peplus]